MHSTHGLPAGKQAILSCDGHFLVIEGGIEDDFHCRPESQVFLVTMHYGSTGFLLTTEV
jgi:hypothetical protein